MKFYFVYNKRILTLKINQAQQKQSAEVKIKILTQPHT
jgi:hypothetical protein